VPRILLLSTTTGYQLRSFGDAARRLGVEIAFATDRCHMLDDPWQDSAIVVRFHDETASLEAIERAAADRPIDGVVAVGDRPVVLAALAAEALGVPGNPPSAAVASANKQLARRRFEAAGLRVPWYVTTRTAIDPRMLTIGTRFPCVVKPIGLSGSRGVIRANDAQEFVAALERVYALLARPDIRALRTGLDDEVLIEGYIEGREYAVEGVLTDGRLQVFAIFDKPDLLEGPFFEETVYVTPSTVAGAQRRALIETVQRAAEALGLKHGAVHAECRLGPSGVFMLEIASRPIGGLCSRVLRFRGLSPLPVAGIATGQRENADTATEKGDCPLEEVLLRHALGEDVSAYHLADGGASVMMIPIPRKGILRRVDGLDRARAVAHVDDVIITAKTHQLLEPLPEAGSYLGFIFARAGTPADAERAVRQAHAHLQFTIDPQVPVIAG
jgi:adenine/guanine phosphoribosyltransferase-like PRPP-binding protein